MIGKPKSQISLLDSAFNRRQKKSRAEKLLIQINQFVDWAQLVSIVEPIYKKSRRGRPTIPIVFLIKCLILQYLYNLSDPALEDALIDRLSFQKFVGLSFEEEIPDFTTIWKFRERLIKAGIMEDLFHAFLRMLDERKLILRKGTLVDASIVHAARKPNLSKKGSEKQQNSQQDQDAKATVKNQKGYYGYKCHIGVDQGSGIIRKAEMTPANVHDSRIFEQLVSGDERSVFADKAYASEDRKKSFRKRGVYYGIMDKGYRNNPISNKQRKKNQQKSRVRNAVERPFAHMKRIYGFIRVRYVRLLRNKLHFLFLCIIHNIRPGLALCGS